MKHNSQIWNHLKGTSADEEDRRGTILDGLLRAFNEGGEEAATAHLHGQMTELEGDFDKVLRKLETLL